MDRQCFVRSHEEQAGGHEDPSNCPAPAGFGGLPCNGNGDTAGHHEREGGEIGRQIALERKIEECGGATPQSRGIDPQQQLRDDMRANNDGDQEQVSREDPVSQPTFPAKEYASCHRAPFATVAPRTPLDVSALIGEETSLQQCHITVTVGVRARTKVNRLAGSV